jgi:hypothetical protein
MWRKLANKTVIVSWYSTKEQAGEPKRQQSSCSGFGAIGHLLGTPPRSWP